MHINHFRAETREAVGRRRKFRPNSWAWYKRHWSRTYRRWLRDILDVEPEGPRTTSRYARAQKTRIIYW